MRFFDSLNGKLAIVKSDKFFYVYKDEQLLRELVVLRQTEVLVVIEPVDVGDIVYKVLTRQGIGFTLYHELKNITPV